MTFLIEFSRNAGGSFLQIETCISNPLSAARRFRFHDDPIKGLTIDAKGLSQYEAVFFMYKQSRLYEETGKCGRISL